MKEQEQVEGLFEPSRLQLDDGRVVRVTPVSLAIEVSDDHTVVVEPGSGEPQVVYNILGDIVRAAEIALDIYNRVKGDGGGGGGKQKCTTTTSTTSKPDGSVTTTTTTSCSPA